MNTYAYQHPEWAHFMSLLAVTRSQLPYRAGQRRSARTSLAFS